MTDKEKLDRLDRERKNKRIVKGIGWVMFIAALMAFLFM